MKFPPREQLRTNPFVKNYLPLLMAEAKILVKNKSIEDEWHDMAPLFNTPDDTFIANSLDSEVIAELVALRKKQQVYQIVADELLGLYREINDLFQLPLSKPLENEVKQENIQYINYFKNRSLECLDQIVLQVTQICTETFSNKPA